MKKEEIEQRLIENKQERKQLKQQLKDLPCLDVGKWYKYPNYENWLLCVVGFKNGMIVNSYGFNCNSGWMVGWNQNKVTEMNNAVPATDKEVEEALIKEAKKRGFENVGGKINSLHNGNSLEIKIKGNFSNFGEVNELWKAGALIFNNGKWAEIIQTKTVELNGNYTEVQLKDILNSQF